MAPSARTAKKGRRVVCECACPTIGRTTGAREGGILLNRLRQKLACGDTERLRYLFDHGERRIRSPKLDQRNRRLINIQYVRQVLLAESAPLAKATNIAGKDSRRRRLPLREAIAERLVRLPLLPRLLRYLLDQGLDRPFGPDWRVNRLSKRRSAP